MLGQWCSSSLPAIFQIYIMTTRFNGGGKIGHNELIRETPKVGVWKP